MHGYEKYMKENDQKTVLEQNRNYKFFEVVIKMGLEKATRKPGCQSQNQYGSVERKILWRIFGEKKENDEWGRRNNMKIHKFHEYTLTSYLVGIYFETFRRKHTKNS